MSAVLAIDPGNIRSAYCLIDGAKLKPMMADKVSNAELIEIVERLIARDDTGPDYVDVAIENIECFGMPVGREVIDTAIYIGMLTQLFKSSGYPVRYVFRSAEKLHICGSKRANDASIRRALIDRFANHDLKNGKGTKANPDFFYGFRADMWSAYAVGLTYIETKLNAPREGI